MRSRDASVIFTEPVKSATAKSSNIDRVRHKLQCQLCGDRFDTHSENEIKNHLKIKCSAIPSEPLVEDYTSDDLAYRLATYGTLVQLNVCEKDILIKRKRKPPDK